MGRMNNLLFGLAQISFIVMLVIAFVSIGCGIYDPETEFVESNESVNTISKCLSPTVEFLIGEDEVWCVYELDHEFEHLPFRLQPSPELFSKVSENLPSNYQIE